jgi:hypothetical protein
MGNFKGATLSGTLKLGIVPTVDGVYSGEVYVRAKNEKGEFDPPSTDPLHVTVRESIRWLVLIECGRLTDGTIALYELPLEDKRPSEDILHLLEEMHGGSLQLKRKKLDAPFPDK